MTVGGHHIGLGFIEASKNSKCHSTTYTYEASSLQRIQIETQKQR